MCHHSCCKSTYRFLRRTEFFFFLGALEGGLTPPAKPSTAPPSEFVLPPLPPPLPPPAEGSPLLNTDVDTNYVENGDDGSKRLRVDATVGQSVPDASTLSEALRREQYSSDEARMLTVSLAKFLEEQQEEHADAAACSVLFGEREDRDEALLQRAKCWVDPRQKQKKESFVGDSKRSAVFKAFQVEDSSSPFCGVSQEHEVAKAPRTLLCQQRRVSVPVQRTDIFTPVVQVYRGRQSLRVAQAPSCPDPYRRVRPVVGGRLWPACVSPCEDESHDHVNSPHFCDLVDGVQGARHVVPASVGLASPSGVGVSRSAEERDALQRSGARPWDQASAGMASSPVSGGSRSAEENAALQRSGPVARATTGESERIIGLRESDC